jgi:hypothetical protein
VPAARQVHPIRCQRSAAVVHRLQADLLGRGGLLHLQLEGVRRPALPAEQGEQVAGRHRQAVGVEPRRQVLGDWRLKLVRVFTLR